MMKAMMARAKDAVKAAAAKKSGSASPSSAVPPKMEGMAKKMKGAVMAAKKSGSESPSKAAVGNAKNLRGAARAAMAAMRGRPFADGGMAKKGASKSKKDCK